MKPLTDKELEKIEELKKQKLNLKAAYDLYNLVDRDLSNLNRRLKEQKEYEEYHKIIKDCEYRGPEYARMGSSPENGYAYFKSQEQAKLLVKTLAHGYERSYAFGYELEWEGPGPYKVEPSWSYDHDRDVVYTATFKKIE